MIILECNADETLVTALGFNDIQHESGRGEVCKKVRKTDGAFGLIDEDPLAVPDPYLKLFTLSTNEKSLRLFVENNGNRRIVVIRPRLEDWILQTAKISKVSMKDFDLPGTSKELHDILNNYPRKKIRFKELVEHLLEVSDRVQLLKQLLKKNK
jgi:hypothetical protein